ncbi:aminotransferase class I/II-fold pyridoxal phosphate-dependent enzyme [Kiloniella sp. EL199]|uniref:aminotransferase class I/II-fold pyridoxal phosphate-dependent enzyme n=1 Tax=Kiloniella sp. EL199 TaxID=2107581 RepID=UPI000EA1B006|nr:aminotransferase class I/II-fold pyridoxal phosphate-dependent enzyme [Kiloniella sp. EL199]
MQNAKAGESQDEFLPFSKPCLLKEDIDAVTEVLQSGWITTGRKCQELEDIFRTTVGCKHAVALTSATAGMHLAVQALEIGTGDEVITPSMTWVSTANMIVTSGAKPVFVDVDRDTLTTTAEQIEPLITERTKLIVPVHFAGASVNLDPILELGKHHNIPVIEDAAHALGTYYKNRHVGKRGTSIFSLHPIKNITTGEGGIFCTNDDNLAERIRRLKFHGLAVDAFDRKSQGRSPQAEVQEPGFKYNMPDLNAVLGLGQMRRLSQINEQRARIAALYQEHLRDIDGIVPLGVPPHTSLHSWHLFIVRIMPEITGLCRDDFMESLKNKGIGTGIHFKAIHKQRYYRKVFPGLNHLGNTEWNSERICSLPLFPDMSDQDTDRVINAIRETLKQKVSIV